jgi:hypothetical protein
MRARGFIAVLLVGVIMWWGAAAAHSAVGTVKGVVERDGAPVAGVKVVIESGSDSSYSASARTGNDGTFTFSNAPVGEFEVKAYDRADELLASSKGILEKADDVVILLLQVVP